MRKIRVLLSSSSELTEDRNEFESFISRENNALISKGVFLELVIWEDFIESMSQTRLQEEYKKAFLNSDIFILLLFTKVGKYVLEEFEIALDSFNKTGKPLVYTYFKDAPITLAEVNHKSLMHVFDFQEKLKNAGHFYSSYRSIDTLKRQFSDQLNKILDNDILNQGDVKEIIKQNKHKVFISYSHCDKPFLDRLLVHLKPLAAEGLIDIWDDTKLKPGDDWKKEIDRNLRDTGFAILLISADFLASDFIVKNELPPLLSAAEKKGTRITPIVVKPCRFVRDKKLSIYQTVNSPTKPLSNENENEREKIYDKVAEWIEVYLSSDNESTA